MSGLLPEDFDAGLIDFLAYQAEQDRLRHLPKVISITAPRNGSSSPPPAQSAILPDRKVKLASLSTFLDSPPIRWRVYKLVQGQTLLWAGPGSYKTFLAISWAVCVASGRPWQGRKVEPGAVVYIVGEGSTRAFYNRVQIAGEAIGLTKEEILALPIYCVEGAVDLSRYDSSWVKELQSEIRKLPTSVGLIVVDTVSRCLTGDENLQEVMQGFLHTLDTLRAAHGCDIVSIHHSGVKGNRERCSTVLGAGVDCNLQIRKIKPDKEGDNPLLGLHAIKLKDAETMDEPELMLEVVETVVTTSTGEVAVDEEGEEVTTCYLKEVARNDFQDAIFNFVTANPGLTSNAVAKGVKKKKQTVLNALKILSSYGQLRRTDLGWEPVPQK